MKEKSYTDGKAHGKKAKETFVLDLYVEMLLSESLLKAERERLSSKIDRAIDNRDRHEFFRLSHEYKNLTKKFGT